MLNLPSPSKFTLHYLASPPAGVSPDAVTAQRSARNDSPSFNSADQQNKKMKGEKIKARPAAGVENTSCVSAWATSPVKSMSETFHGRHMVRPGNSSAMGLGGHKSPRFPVRQLPTGTKGCRQQKQLHRGRLDVHLLQKFWIQPWTSASFCTGIGDTSAGTVPGSGQANAS